MFSSIWAADAGELVTAAYLNAFAHPPGFPLYLLLLKLFFLLPGNEAANASQLSLLFWCVGLVATGYGAYRLTHNKLISWGSAAAFFSSWPLLLYGNVQEVWSMTVALIALMTVFIIRYLQNKRDSDFLAFLGLFFVSLFHHYIVALIIPALVIVLWSDRKAHIAVLRKHLALILLFICVGIAPYIIWFVGFHRVTYLFWEPHTITGLFRMIARSQYGSFNTSAPPQTLLVHLQNVGGYLYNSAHHSGYVFLLVLAGTYHAWKNKTSREYVFVVTQMLITGVFLLLYLNAPFNGANAKGIVERYYLISYPSAALLVAVGIGWVLEIIQHTPHLRSPMLKTVLRWGIVILLCVAVPIALILKNIPALRRLNTERPFERHAQNMLDAADKNSVLILYGDLDLFPVMYMRYVKNYRSDTTVVQQMSLQNYDYRNFVAPKTEDQEEAVIVFAKKHPTYFNQFPLPGSYGLIEEGLLNKVDIQPKARVVSRPLSSDTQLYIPFNESQAYFYKALQEKYARTLFDSANEHFKKKNYEEVVPLMRYAHLMFPKNSDYISLFGVSLIRTRRCPEAEMVLLRYVMETQDPRGMYALSRVYNLCFNDPDKFSYWNRLYKQMQQERQ